MKTVTHTRAAVALALTGAFAASSAWACDAPTVPRSLPDGRKADVNVMLEAKRSVEHYVQQVAAYASCEKDALKLQEVVASQKLVMNQFNAEVRAFNAQARTMKVSNR